MRTAPVLMLALLSPFVAEFLLADQYLLGPVSLAQLGMFLFLLPLYGFGAVLIRELARRTGRGWPTIVLLGLAFGVIEEGLLTQSLFNPGYAGAHLLDFGFVPALGIAGPWTVYVLALHTVWSICAPIAVVEACFPGREPWLGKVGFGVSGGLYLVGAAITFAVSYGLGPQDAHFMATPAQLISSAVLAVALMAAAFTGFHGRPSQRRANQWLAFAVALGLSTVFQILFRYGERWLSAPVVTVAELVVLAIGALIVARWLRGAAFGLAAGVLVTYCWLGWLTAQHYGTAATIEQTILVAATLALLVAVSGFLRRGNGNRAQVREVSAAEKVDRK